MSAQDAAPRRVEIAVAVIERDGQFLIAERPADVPLGGFWEFPGGKIERDETPEAAAVRECLEEVGLKIRITGSYPVATHDYDHAALRLHFLSATLVAGADSLPPRFRWVSASELGRYRFPPANCELIALLTRRTKS
jgi:8-oxo-dGTP diphosphatase